MSLSELSELKRFFKGLAAGDPLEKERRQKSQRYCEQMRSEDVKEVLRSMNQIAAKQSVRSQDHQKHTNHSFQWDLRLLKCSFCPTKGQPLVRGKNTCDGSATQTIPKEYNSEEKITERCASCSAFCCKYAETRHYALTDPGFEPRLCNSLAAKLYLIDLDMQAEIQSNTYYKRAKDTRSSMAGIPRAEYNKKYLGWKGFHHATVDKGKAKDLSHILVKNVKNSKDITQTDTEGNTNPESLSYFDFTPVTTPEKVTFVTEHSKEHDHSLFLGDNTHANDREGSSSGEKVQTNDDKIPVRIDNKDVPNSPEYSKKYEKGKEHAFFGPPYNEIFDEDSVVTVAPKSGHEHSSGKKIQGEVDMNDKEKNVEDSPTPESTGKRMFKNRRRNKEKKGKNKTAPNSPQIGESSAMGAKGTFNQRIHQTNTAHGLQKAELNQKRSFLEVASLIRKSPAMSKVNEAVHTQKQEPIFRRFRRSTQNKAVIPPPETPNNLMYELLHYLAMDVEEDICIFMKCHECDKSFCPDCIKRCEEKLCGRPLCPSCQRAEVVDYLKENTDFTEQQLNEADLRGTWNKCTWHRSL